MTENDTVAMGEKAEGLLKQIFEEYEKGSFAQVEQLCKRGLESGEAQDEFLYFLGCAKFESGQPENALNFLRKAVEINPAHKNALYMLAGTYHDLGRYPEAIHYADLLIELNPDLHMAHHLKGLALFESMEFWASLEEFRAAYALETESPSVISSLGNNLRVIGSTEEALHLLEDAYARFPEHPGVKLNLAGVYVEYGRREEAIPLYREVLQQDPGQGVAYTNLADCKRWTQGDSEEFQQFETRLTQNPAKDVARGIHFALGKMYNDIRDFDKAFSHYQEANSLRYAVFDIREKQRWLSNIKSTFDADLIQGYRERQPSETEGSDLIFIIGFPRSGSTLLERMLAASDRIEGVGEVASLHLGLSRLVPVQGESFLFPDEFSENIEANVDALTQDYRTRVREIAPDAPMIVDKTLFNFEHLGLLYLMFPGAKYIHTTCHPLDSCLSSYFQNFLAGLFWSYSLKNTAQYYNYYREVMDYWESLLPLNILEVRYEDLVRHPQEESRRIYEYLGVEWTPAVLETHRSDAKVTTASKQQVREKIYTQSVERWHGYAGYLRPLANELSEFLSEDDLRFFSEKGIVIGEPRAKMPIASTRSTERPQGWAWVGRFFARIAGRGRKE